MHLPPHDAPPDGAGPERLRRQIEDYAQRIDGAAPVPPRRELRRLLRETHAYQAWRHDLARWTRVEMLGETDPEAALDQLDGELAEIERKFDPGGNLRKRLAHHVRFEDELRDLRRRFEAAGGRPEAWLGLLEEHLREPGRDGSGWALDPVRLRSRDPGLAATLALLPAVPVPDDGTREELLGLVGGLARTPPASRNLPPDLEAQARKLRRRGRLGALLEVTLARVGSLSTERAAVDAIRRLADRVDPAALALVLPSLASGPDLRRRLREALTRLGDFDRELAEGGDAVDEARLAEQWRTLRTLPEDFWQLPLPARAGAAPSTVDERGRMAERRANAVAQLAALLGAQPDRAPSYDGDEELARLAEPHGRLLDDCRWLRWLEVAERLEAARARLAVLMPLRGDRSPQELLQGARIANVDQERYWPADLRVRVATAEEVLAAVGDLLEILVTNPDDEPALVRVDQDRRGRPSQAAQAWRSALAKELAPGGGTLARRVALAYKRVDFVNKVCQNPASSNGPVRLREDADQWRGDRELWESAFVDRLAGPILTPHLLRRGGSRRWGRA